jgi:hypothetical protein
MAGLAALLVALGGGLTCAVLWVRGLDELVRARRTDVPARGLQRRVRQLTSMRRRNALASGLRIVAGEGVQLPRGAMRGMRLPAPLPVDARLRRLLLEVAGLLECASASVDAATVLRLERLASYPPFVLREHATAAAQELGAIRYVLTT